MSTPTWIVRTHIIPASHPRGYRRGVRDPQSSTLKLHVKQYIPAARTRSQPTAPPPSLIVHHGMPPGGTKEAYEPFLHSLVTHPRCPPIRAIWTIDAAGCGQSYLLNRDEIGDEPHWFDSARDVLAMINFFQAEMKPPLVGMGQSWGCVAMLMAASWHARVFQGVVLSEPVVENGWWHRNDPRRVSGELPRMSGTGAGVALAKRRSSWASWEEAKAYFELSGTYHVVRYDLRELEDGRVELVTPTAQVVPFFMRPSPPLPGYPEGEDYATRLEESEVEPGFYTAMGPRVKAAMPGIHCPVLYLWAKENSFISDDAYRERLISITGTGLGGGGGKAKGQITEMFVDGNHFLPLFQPVNTAEATVDWLAQKFWPWWTEEEAVRSAEAPISPGSLPAAFYERLEAGIQDRKGRTKL